MELLRDLRVETKQAEAVTSAKAARKRKAMLARLEKVRQRKRLKMGLPMKGKSSGSHPTDGCGGSVVMELNVSLSMEAVWGKKVLKVLFWILFKVILFTINVDKIIFIYQMMIG